MRPIRLTTKPNLGFVLTNVYTDGTNEVHKFAIDDTFKTLDYVTGGEVVSVSGRFAGINSKIKAKAGRNYKSVNEPINDVFEVENVQVDCSKENHANIVSVPAEEILEYQATKEVCHVELGVSMSVEVEIYRSDRTTKKTVLEEGSIMSGVTLLGKNGHTDLGCDEKKDITVRNFVMSISIKTGAIDVLGVVNEDGTDAGEYIPFIAFKDFGTAVEVAATADDVAAAVEAANASGEPVTIVVPADMTIDKDLILTGDITIRGEASLARDVQTVSQPTITKMVVIRGENANVHFENLSFTDEGWVLFEWAKSFSAKNCSFKDIVNNGTSPNVFASAGYQESDALANTVPEMLFVLDGCLFGANTRKNKNDKAVYNLMDLYFAMADGSKIENCIFEENCCSHNHINIYAAGKGATIEMNKNYFAYSGNAIRIGCAGSAEATFKIYENTYDATDTTDAGVWAGLVMVYGAGNLTTTMKDVKIYLNGNQKPEGDAQLYYVYRNGNINEETAPVIYVDNVEEDPAIIHPDTVASAR